MNKKKINLKQSFLVLYTWYCRTCVMKIIYVFTVKYCEGSLHRNTLIIHLIVKLCSISNFLYDLNITLIGHRLKSY